MPVEICKKEKCTGCFACMNICPCDAIAVGTDEYGKTVPVIKKEKCIECERCVKVCPMNQRVDYHYPMQCYAAWAKNEEERKDCSSGGIATELSKAVVEEGGVVYGAAFDQNLELAHMRAVTKEDLQNFKGSKYVQSYIGMSFRMVKEDLKEGKKVLFIGTPCQVAGIKAYLGREYENLLIVDLICHGTPPMEYLKEYLQVVDPKKRTRRLTFRGEKDYCFTLYDEKGELYCAKSNRDPYFYGFLKGLIHRDNCYQCVYAKAERCSDITIGDFWGLQRESLNIAYNGRISVVLINTSNGTRMWEMYKNLFFFEERTVEEAVEGNAQLRRASLCHADRSLFLKRYKRQGFTKAVRTPRVKKELLRNRMRVCVFYKMARKVKKKIMLK